MMSTSPPSAAIARAMHSTVPARPSRHDRQLTPNTCLRLRRGVAGGELFIRQQLGGRAEGGDRANLSPQFLATRSVAAATAGMRCFILTL